MILITVIVLIIFAIITKSYGHFGTLADNHNNGDDKVTLESLQKQKQILEANSFFLNSIDMTTFVEKTTNEMPVIFLSHAAPVLIMKENEGFLGRKNDSHFKSAVANWYRSIPKKMNLIGPNKPTAIVQFSAHYDTHNGPIKVLAQDTYKGGLLYDYGGFPQYTYEVTYPAPGSTQLAKKIVTMLSSSGVQATIDTNRGIDHGGFIPLLLMYPEADIPVLQISICNNPAKQRQIGEILAPLRKSGVLFMGSGQATHGSFRPNAVDIKQQEDFVKAFTSNMYPEDWSNDSGKERYVNGILQTTTEDNQEDKPKPTPEEIYKKRSNTVDNWSNIPGARFAHPDYDHYMPMPGCVGLTKGSEDSRMHIIGDFWLLGIHSLRTFVWGDYPYRGHESSTTVQDSAAHVVAPAVGKDEL